MPRQSGSINHGFWHDNPASYFSIRYPDAFARAIEEAKENGTLNEWTWAMLLGKVAPPGYSENGQKQTSHCA